MIQCTLESQTHSSISFIIQRLFPLEIISLIMPFLNDSDFLSFHPKVIAPEKDVSIVSHPNSLEIKPKFLQSAESQDNSHKKRKKVSVPYLFIIYAFYEEIRLPSPSWCLVNLYFQPSSLKVSDSYI